MTKYVEETIEFTKNQEKIAYTAFSLIAENGYKATTTKEIAVKSGVNESTIFKNFGNKLELFRKVFLQSKQELNKQIQTILLLDVDSIEQFIHESTKIVYSSFSEHHNLLTITVRELGNSELKLSENTILENTVNVLTEKLSLLLKREREAFVAPMFMFVTSLMFSVINQENEQALTDELSSNIEIEDISMLTIKMLAV